MPSIKKTSRPETTTRQVITWGLLTLLGSIIVIIVTYLFGPLAFASQKQDATIISPTTTSFPHLKDSAHLVRLQDGTVITAQGECNRRAACDTYKAGEKVRVLTTPLTSEAIIGDPGDAFGALLVGWLFTLLPTIFIGMMFRAHLQDYLAAHKAKK